MGGSANKKAMANSGNANTTEQATTTNDRIAELQRKVNSGKATPQEINEYFETWPLTNPNARRIGEYQGSFVINNNRNRNRQLQGNLTDEEYDRWAWLSSQALAKNITKAEREEFDKLNNKRLTEREKAIRSGLKEKGFTLYR